MTQFIQQYMPEITMVAGYLITFDANDYRSYYVR